MKKLNKNIILLNNTDKVILYNTLNETAIEISKDLIDVNNYCVNVDNSSENILMENLFFNKDSSGKPLRKTMDEIRETIKYTDKFASFLIHVGYDCNLSCSYCYQQDIKIKKILTDEVESDLYHFFKKVRNNNNLDVVDITFIGGEPLLHIKKIIRIAKKCKKIFNDIKINFSIVTNGTIFSESVISDIKKIEWSFFQITLDGNNEYHDLLRCDKYGNGSFLKIIENLQIMQKERINVVLNFNLCPGNVDSLYGLIDTLKKSKISYPLSFSLIFDSLESSPKHLNSNMNSDIWKRAHEIAIERGYNYTPFYRMPYMVCELQRVNSFNISPDGYIYKCISGMENERFNVGHINEYLSIMYIQKVSQFVEYEPRTKECLSCKSEIVCGGGCYFKELAYGRICESENIQYNESPILNNYFYRRESHVSKV